MIPETNILGVISNLWVENFPVNNSTSFPKGIVKRVSTPLVVSKDRTTPRQFNSRISIIWYDTNSIGFDAKMEAIITALYGLESDASIINVSYDSRTDGYDPNTDKHIMNLDFIIKHYTT